MNSITIIVPWLPMLIGLGIIGAFFVICRVVRGVKSFNLHELRELRRRKEENQAAAARSLELLIAKRKSVFVHPWEIAFDGCQKRTKAMARGWIQKWISEQKDLPLLNAEAAQILAKELDSDSLREAVVILAPYFNVGDYVSDTSDANLRAELPEVWYKFWKELEGYPARWSLFLAKVRTTPHVATRTSPSLIPSSSSDSKPSANRSSLTSEQASLLAKALGDASHGAELYASILVRYIVSAAPRVFHHPSFNLDLKDGSPIPEPHTVDCLCEFCESYRTKFAFNEHDIKNKNKENHNMQKTIIPEADF